MDWLEASLHRYAQQLSRLLDPLMFGLERLALLIRQQLDMAGVSYDWQSRIITAGWVLVLFMVVRTLAGWLRMVVLLIALVILVKAYGVLPGG